MTPTHEPNSLEAVRVWLLGGFRVSVGSRMIDENHWRLRKAAALVKLLALAPNHRLHREQVMYLLWPTLGPDAAANNLRRTLHSARRTLELTLAGAPRYLVSLRDGLLQLCPVGSLWVDVEAFEEAAAMACCTREPSDYWAALDLYTGDLLPEDRYEEWTEVRRERLVETYGVLLAEVTALHNRRGELGPAFEALRRTARSELTLGVRHEGATRPHALSAEVPESSESTAGTQSPPGEPGGRLTSREQQVAVLVARGLTNRQIAESIGVSERTIDAHIRKIFCKLSLCCRAQLATWATERGLRQPNTS